MKKCFVSLLMLACCLSVAYCEHNNYNEDGGDNGQVAASDGVNSLFNTNVDASSADSDVAKDNLDKRVERYAFGLGRRAYTYTNGGNGIKRLPVYNFGLGKRARPYSFGLGKRFDYDDYEQMAENANLMAARGMLAGFGTMNDDKRNRPYSFGLGKRSDGGQSYSRPYGFGLGRR
ncbi:allatostatin-A-like [Musca domestica]|uniref:Allatostatin-A-like n=1 Tax=Musca domestica TaxID=7370 RepID=A0ABM3VLN1_MUSDO|nr:allatostatin-A-like [Musca domestica]